MLAQQPTTSSPNTTPIDKQQAFTQARQLLKQAGQLREQGTAEQRQQALAKYEEALKIWQQLAVNEAPPYVAHSFAAATLDSIGTIYYIQDEPQKALNSFEQGLAVSRDRKNRLQEAIARLSADTASFNSDDKQKLLNSYKQALTSTNRGEAALLGSLGNAYSRLGDNQKALDYYNQALSLYRAEKQPSDEASTLSSIGRLYLKLGKTQSSLDSYNRALEIQRAEKDTTAQAETLQEIGSIYTGLGEPQKALAAYNQALELQREIKDLAGQADTFSQIGLLYSSLGEEQRAVDTYNQALKLQQAAQGNLSETALAFNLTRQAQILRNIGLAYTSLGLGDSAKALDFYSQARSLYQKAGDKDGEASILNQISYLYNQLGDKQNALNVLNQALVLRRAIPDPDGEAYTLRDIADIYNSIAQPQQALDFYRQALDIQRRVNQRPEQAVTRNKMAQVYSSLGDYQLSIDTHNQALEIFRAIGDRPHQIETLNNIGLVYQSAKDYQKSLDSLEPALTLARQNKDFLRQFPILTAIARDYESLKDYPKALDAANQILSLSHQQNSSHWEAISLAMSGRVYLASGDYPKALETTQKAVTELRKVGTRLGEANALRNLGKIYTSLKQYEQALSTYDRDLELRRMSGDRTGEAETLYQAAITQRDRGNLNQARTQIEATLKIVEDIRTKVISPELRTSYFASVQDYYQFYIDLLMQLHKKDPSQGYDALALHASERARARSLLELLTEAYANIRQGVDPKLVEQERTLEQQLNAAVQRQFQLLNSQHTDKQLADIKQQIESLNTQLAKIQDQIRKTSPRYANLQYPQPLNLQQIQSTVLDDDTLLLEYSLGQQHSYLWAVTKTSITSYELPKRTDIEAAAQRFYERTGKQKLPERRGLGAAPRTNTVEVINQLSQMLLSPVAGKLGQKRLLIVSDSALQYLPFAALPAPDTLEQGNTPVPLIVKHEIVNLPSASTLAVIRQDTNGRKIAPKTIAVLADPVFSANDQRVKTIGGQVSRLPGGGTGFSVHPTTDTLPVQPATSNNLNTLTLNRAIREIGATFDRLPYTRTEANSILKLASAAQSMPAFDFAANFATATNPQLSQYKIVHFATHGILDSVHPERSGVVLSLVDEQGNSQPNGFLQLNDIFNLNLPAELVVLSACETGLGQDVKGEGLVGLTRGFMYAGASRVLVSLWSIADAGTSELMSRFYRKMLQDGLKPAAALRAAQIEMLQTPQWKDPFYWAAFTLQGEWR